MSKPIKQASGISCGICDHCAGIHVNLRDAKGNVFASALVPVETGDAFVVGFMACMAEINGRARTRAGGLQ